ncbi:hypothetical protein JOF56_002210 [Kibdelosporangium banguiense]|uniref:DUF3618 domain-containing protein n=1 Tax=Kibdelosporangium banguiense TaxID=1365924 RepID=A0ABS4TBM4_9PSEU|nr:hypothetical protein [Kibdelosporangium banguiense]MBP2321825.1 hypothetical protein [Kibdelosporangium banguiense]
MTRAPEAVDKAVDAVRRAEHKLVESAAEVATKTRRTRRKLVKKAKAGRKDLAKNAKKAKTAAQHLAGAEPRRRRRWPWLIALAAAAAGTAVVIRSKSATQSGEVFTPEPRSEDDQPETKSQENGRPQPAKPASRPKQ